MLTTAAQFGDRALFDTMTAELKKTTDRQQRSRILGAMGSFRDPAIARAGMDLVIHSEIDARESLSLLFGPLGTRETEKLPFEFVKANYDELLKRLPTGGGFEAGSMLPYVGGNSCDEASRQEFVGFFEERAKKFTGGAAHLRPGTRGHPPLRSPEVRPRRRHRRLLRKAVAMCSLCSPFTWRSWRLCEKPFFNMPLLK